MGAYKVILVLYFSLVLTREVTQAQLCPSGYHTYNTGSCLTVQNATRQQFSQARTICQTTNNGDLITVSSSGELFVLKGYVRALGEQGVVFWVGYRYSGSTLQSVVDGSSAPDIVTSNIASNGVSGTDGICLGLRHDGMFVNTICTTTLDYVCTYTITNPTVSTIQVNTTTVSDGSSQTIQFGEQVMLTCTFTDTASTSTVQWSLDGTLISSNMISTVSDVSNSTLNLTPFVTAGVYQCMVSNIDGRTAKATVQLYGDLNNNLVPGPMTNIIALPDSNTSLFVQWLPPRLSYVNNPLLLQYTLYYSTSIDINYANTDLSKSGLTTDNDGMGTYILTGLLVNTSYYLALRAENNAGLGAEPLSVTLSTTYGRAPSNSPQRLTLVRNDRNTALLADWDDVVTSPPGELAFYEVEFRDRGSSIVTRLFIDPDFSFASIFNVKEAQSYEVRVRSAVQVKREPRLYDFSPYSIWVNVTGITTNIPTVPTIQPVQDNIIPITVGIVVPIVVIIIVLCITAFIIGVYCNTRTNEGNDYPDGRPKRQLSGVTNPNNKDSQDTELKKF